MRRWLFLVWAMAACPAPGIELSSPATFEAGKPVAIEARVSFSFGKVAASGRAHVALRLPARWEVRGEYRLRGTTYELQPAPVIAEVYELRHPEPRSRWHALVSRLHTDLAENTLAEARLTLLPPADAAEDVTLGIAWGIAPSYPKWTEVSGPRRTLVLRARR
jgi:hypothetical protein